VIGEVEVQVVDPHGIRQVAGHLDHPLPVARHQRQARLHEGGQRIQPARRRIEDQHATHMHGGAGFLQVQERGVQSAEPLDHRSPPG
jgi:hypothetical protein